MRTHPWFIAGLLTATGLMGQTSVSMLPQAQAQVVTVGAGSYLTQGGGKSNPIKSENLKGAAPTTQWFTNLVFKGKGAEREYPHPLAVRPTGSGLKIYYPGPYIKSTAGGINGAMPDTAELELGCSEGGAFSDVLLDAYSDWFIRVAFASAARGR